MRSPKEPNMRVSRLTIAALLIALSTVSVAQKRSITEKDIFQFVWIGDPQISPDGSRVAFVKVTVNDKKDNYDTSIWSVSTRGDEAARRMTDGRHDSSPRWSRMENGWCLYASRKQAEPRFQGCQVGLLAQVPVGHRLRNFICCR